MVIFLLCRALLIFRAFPLGETNCGVSLSSAQKGQVSLLLFLSRDLDTPCKAELSAGIYWIIMENESVPVMITVRVCVELLFVELLCYGWSLETVIPHQFSATSSENELRS